MPAIEPDRYRLRSDESGIRIGAERTRHVITPPFKAHLPEKVCGIVSPDAASQISVRLPANERCT